MVARFAPHVRPIVVRRPWLVLAGAQALYAATCRFARILSAHPDSKVWFFNRLAWQVPFHLGAALAVLSPQVARLDRYRLPITVAAVLYLAFAATIAPS